MILSTFDDKISTTRTFSDHPSCRSRRSWEYSTRPSDLSSSWTIPGTKREQKMGDGMWEIISLVVNRLLSPRITIRYRCWGYCAGRNVHARWKVTRYRLFSHTMSLGATRSWHDRVKRETDRVLPAKRKYLFCKRFRAYLETMKSFTSFHISRQIFQNSTCFKYSFSNNNFALLFNSSLYNDESDEVSINSWSKFWVIN